MRSIKALIFGRRFVLRTICSLFVKDSMDGFVALNNSLGVCKIKNQGEIHYKPYFYRKSEHSHHQMSLCNLSLKLWISYLVIYW